MDLSKLGTSEGVISNARVPETVDALEKLASCWCQQIEQVNYILCILYSCRYCPERGCLACQWILFSHVASL